MKKILSILLISVFLLGCSDDNESNIEPAENRITTLILSNNIDAYFSSIVLGSFNGKTWNRIDSVGTLKKGDSSKKIEIYDDQHLTFSIFCESNATSEETFPIIRLDPNYTIEKHKDNIVEIEFYSKGIRVDINDPSEYPL